MPRPKLYKNKEERRKAACEKAKRHYDKNSETIKERKKLARVKYLREIEYVFNALSYLSDQDWFVNRQHELEVRKAQQRDRLLKRGPETKEDLRAQEASDIRLYNRHYQSLKTKLLVTLLKGNPAEFFEGVYQQVAQPASSGEHVCTHLEAIRGGFQYRTGLNDVEELWSQVWNSLGSGRVLDKFSALRDGYRAVERALSDIEVAILEECLVEQHERGRFMYQSKVFLQDFQDLP
ncbi:hypothetical protein V5O48_016640 [Marasmius crinis-equi]|uniref:Uncharacterized protein n=1 Tax=Marasmius crinis-equi TaxID=585013 RepID=A0ABR3ER84_9AGAR